MVWVHSFQKNISRTALVSSNHSYLWWGFFSLFTMAFFSTAEYGTFNKISSVRRAIFLICNIAFFQLPIEISNAQIPPLHNWLLSCLAKDMQLNSGRTNSEVKKRFWPDNFLVTYLNRCSMVDMLKIMMIQFDDLITNRQIFLIRNWPFINWWNKNPQAMFRTSSDAETKSRTFRASS